VGESFSHQFYCCRLSEDMGCTVADLFEEKDAKNGTTCELVSLVIPCLNERATIGSCVKEAFLGIRFSELHGEVIVADNGSVDESMEIAAAEGAKIERVGRKGYGAALRGGIAVARGEFIIMGDADGSYDLSDLAPFIERLRAGDELVIGNRFRGGIRRGAMPWHHRYIGNPILTGILNLFFRTGIGDAHCGMRAVRKEAFERLGCTTPGMEFASEMIVRASLLKMTIGEVPCVLRKDGRDRPPHLRSFRDGWRHLTFLMLFCPLWLFVIPACALMAAGLGVLIWLTPGVRFFAGFGLDVHTMVLAALCVLLGHQTLWLGLFAKHLGARTRALPADPMTETCVAGLTLERGLVAGGIVFVVGISLNAALLLRWRSVDFGDLDAHQSMRLALWGLVAVVAGVQIMFGSLFLDVIRRFVRPAS
jgi:hypothetical protein